MSIYKRFCQETVGENGTLTDISLHYPDNFNFAYDVVDAIAAMRRAGKYPEILFG